MGAAAAARGGRGGAAVVGAAAAIGGWPALDHPPVLELGEVVPLAAAAVVVDGVVVGAIGGGGGGAAPAVVLHLPAMLGVRVEVRARVSVRVKGEGELTNQPCSQYVISMPSANELTSQPCLASHRVTVPVAYARSSSRQMVSRLRTCAARDGRKGVGCKGWWEGGALGWSAAGARSPSGGRAG